MIYDPVRFINANQAQSQSQDQPVHRQDQEEEKRQAQPSTEAAETGEASGEGRDEPERLSEDDRIALANEAKLGFWDQPWPFRTTCYMLFIAAIVQGWNQTATNGANICWLDPLIDGSSTKSTHLTPSGCKAGSANAIKYGVISAAPFLFAPVYDESGLFVHRAGANTEMQRLLAV